MELSRRGHAMTSSVTLALNAKTKRLQDEGVDIISFGAGEPDYDTPQNIKAAAITAINEGVTKYTPASGTYELKKAICDKLLRDNMLNYTSNEIIISNGAKHSIYNALLGICNPGDEVIIPSPYWVSYPELVKLADAIPVVVESDEEDNFKYTKEKLLKAVTPNTKAIILNSPNNPTGVVYTRDELEMIGEIAVEKDLIIISDEIYEELVYGNSKHISIASLNSNIKERTILVNGMSKAYAMTGWRIGYTASTVNIAKIMDNIQSHSTSNPNSIAQYASVEALNGSQHDIHEMRLEFERRRNYMANQINQIKGLSCKLPEGAFYVMVNISTLFGKTIKGYKINSSVEFCNALLDGARVAVVPGSAFGVDNYIRLSYATSMELIIRGLNRIDEFLNE